MPLTVGPWPWSLLNLLAAVLWAVAVVTAWRSADHVVPANRPWTRAWRILVASAFTIGVDGIWIPIGAIYVAIKYRPANQRPARAASTPS
jgi:hypothetical protein